MSSLGAGEEGIGDENMRKESITKTWGIRQRSSGVDITRRGDGLHVSELGEDAAASMLLGNTRTEGHFTHDFDEARRFATNRNKFSRACHSSSLVGRAVNARLTH
ncbi:hypothetical protein BDW22DRAFT_1101108 [Trametopsis cervina]|nr:hypothetical protein BDW22DRAFT_1101108 [Trametopsis cervina]